MNKNKYQKKLENINNYEINENKPFRDLEFLSLKIALKGILLLLFIFLSFLLIFTIFGNAITDDINYTFQNDELYNNPSITESNFDIENNIREQFYYNGHYEATYSFELEDNGNKNDEIEFIDIAENDTYCYAEIINYYDFHAKVLKLIDNQNDSYIAITNIFYDNQNYGSIEFWIQTTNTSKEIQIIFTNEDDSIIPVLLHIDNGYLAYYNGSWNNIIILNNNIWYHIRIDFECGSGGYEGLSSDTYYIYINTIQYGAYSFWNNANQFGNLKFNSSIIDSNYSIYLDAIGYYMGRPSRFTFEEFTLYDYFDEYNKTPYTIPFEWSYINNTNTFAVIDHFAEISGQYLRLVDQNNVGWLRVRQKFNQYLNEGTISFYMQFSDVDKRYDLALSGSPGYAFGFYSYNNSLWYWYSGSSDIQIYNLTNDVWYYLSFTFDIPSHIMLVYIVNLLIYNGTISNVVYVEALYFQSLSGDGSLLNPYYLLIDEITYDMEGRYNIKDNYMSEITYLNTYETNTFEFAFQDIANDTYAGQDNPLGWNDIETTGDYVNINRMGDDGLIHIQNALSGNIRGIGKTDFNLTDHYINLDFGLFFALLTDPNGYVDIDINSSDNTLITRLRCYTNNDFSYYNGSGYTKLNDEIALNRFYQIKITINYELNIATIYFYIADYPYYWQYDLFNTYEISLITTNKTGLNGIKIRSYVFSVNQLYFFLDWVGISGNNSYYPNEYSYIEIYLDNLDLNIRHNNLLTTRIVGNFGVGINGENELFYGTMVKENIIYTEETTIVINMYEYYEQTYSNATILYWIHTNFNVYSIKLEGVYLFQNNNNNTSWLEYEYANINPDENYFYVLNNTDLLRWTYTCDSSSLLEYIQATFDIQNQYSINSSVRFIGRYGYVAYGFFRVHYAGGSSSITYFKPYSYTTNFLLPPQYEIDTFIITITDNGETINGDASGSITDLSLVFIPNYAMTIVTLSLLEILIPILILILPSSIIYKRFGKEYVIPTLILMSLLCVVTNLIPYWVFFIMLVGFIAILFLQRKGGELS